MRFKIGDRVVCVDNSGIGNDVHKNIIYKVKMFNTAASRIYLEEVSGSYYTYRFELVKPKVNHLPDWL